MGNLTKMESGGFGRDTSCALPLVVHCRPIGKSWMTLQGHDLAHEYYCTTPAEGRNAFLITLPLQQLNEEPPHFKLPVCSSGLLFHNKFPNLPTFLLKTGVSPLFPGLAYGFATACLSRIVILLYSLINLSFASKITGSVYF